jgi:hypothetical protein
MSEQFVIPGHIFTPSLTRVQPNTTENTMAAPTTRTRKDAMARKDTLGFRLIFTTTFLVFLLAAVVDRLVPLRWIMGAAKSENYMAIFAEAKAAAATYTPFAFMG